MPASYKPSSIYYIFLNTCISGISFLFIVAFILNFWVTSSTVDSIYYTSWEVPTEDVALLLGTSKYTQEGNDNPFFKNRINAAALLYYKHKVKHLILSGDNSLSYYNEPQEMRKALIELGVPDSVITLDYAGFRTFDSVIRCQKIFGQNKVIIITQRFHLYRALFIANAINIQACGYAAEAVDSNIAISTLVREYFARCLVIVDLYIINKTPKFLGKKEYINL